MVIKGAIVFKSRSESPTSTIIAVIIIALKGSPFLLVFAKNSLFGRILFSPKASNILGAPTNEPNADESVAPNKPARTMGA